MTAKAKTVHKKKTSGTRCRKTVSRARPVKKKAKKKTKKKISRIRAARGPEFADTFKKGDGRLYLPPDKKTAISKPVAPSKIQAGIQNARTELQGLLEELADLSDGLSLASVELEVSFSADGKFLGVGVGGATSIKVAFAPQADHHE